MPRFQFSLKNPCASCVNVGYTCCRLHICDGRFLPSHHKALSLSVGVGSFLVVLIRLIDELDVQVALAALTGYAGLQARSPSR